MATRVEQSILGRWWWSVDRQVLFLLMALLALGIVLGLAGSPSVAERNHYDTFHFVNRQIFFALVTAPLMLMVSLLPPTMLRRFSLLGFLLFWALVVATLFVGIEVKGAKRWISLIVLQIQPSEFLKPFFVMMAAWAFSQGATKKNFPGFIMATGLLLLTIIPLVLQPDFGQTVLICVTWSAMFFLSGVHLFWIVGLSTVLTSGAMIAYKTMPHVAERIDRFIDPASGDSFQVDTALDAIVSGGFLGKGPGEGTIKRILPDSHTDFLFSVTAEEFGILFCLILVAIFGFIVIRSLRHAAVSSNGFMRLAVSGLVIMFGLQAFINMGVNLQLLPAKGMTLPFISYGGSSLLSLGFALGMLLALTRRRPQAEILN